MAIHSGRHFLQIPGPDQCARPRAARDRPADHRSSRAGVRELAQGVLAGMKPYFRTKNPVVIYPSSGTGAWEAAIVNTLSPGRHRADGRDRPLRDAVANAGAASSVSRSTSSRRLAPRRRCRRDRSELAADRSTRSRRSASFTTRPRRAVTHRRRAQPLDRAGHPALLMVDTISGARLDRLRHDEWGVDVTVGGSQKGLMLPPGSASTRSATRRSTRPKYRKAAAHLLGLGGDASRQQARLLPLHAGDQPACLACGKRSRCSRRKAWTTSLPRHQRLGGHARGRARLGPRGVLPRTGVHTAARSPAC